MKVEMIKHPTQQDWEFCKMCTMNTVGKEMGKLPDEKWKVKILESEHSPIRELWFAFKIKMPYCESVHFSRHSTFNGHYVQSQRNDRQDKYDRRKAPQDAPVSHIITMNAQSFIDMCHVRLCKKASTETRAIMKEIVRVALEKNPEFKTVLVPKCEYRNGKCTEFQPCSAIEKKIEEIEEKLYGQDRVFSEVNEIFAEAVYFSKFPREER